MTRQFDVLILGTGTAAHYVAHPCAQAGLDVAVVDSRRYGGTCARRGCQPKKYLVEAARVVGLSRDLAGLGVGSPADLDWSDLMRAKRDFTDAVPERNEHRFAKAGITQLHGRARFVGETEVEIEGESGTVRARRIVIATGARPRPLDWPGAEYLTDSEAFLDLDAPPRRMVCVGGGYISLEFAHVAAVAGSDVTILHRGSRLLEHFDADLVDRLTEATRAAGIDVHLDAEVARIERDGDDFEVHTAAGERFSADLVLHGAGRVPDLADLDLQAAGVEHGPGGVSVDDSMRSTSNPAVYAVGDAADHPPMLASVADIEGPVAAENLIAGRTVRRFETVPIPSVVFTRPPLAAVGMTAGEAAEQGDRVLVNEGDMSGWPSSKRLGQRHAAFKVMQSAGDGRILGAHVLGEDAADIVNLFALAIERGLTARELQALPWAYPTATSGVKNMVVADPR